ncbi:MAG: TIGR04219 family outer membrane beta-barrel protein [Pseudomonadota bacterium]
MRKKLLALATGSLLIGSVAQADTVLGLYATVDAWIMESSGSFGDNQSSMQEFNLDDDNKVSFSIALEHPIPVLPNLRIRTNDLSTSGDATLTADFSYGDEVFSDSTTVATTFDIQNTDITLYYEVFDNDVVSFDLGLTGKFLDGEITVANEDASLTATESFKGLVPMLYGAVQIGVPATGLSFFGELSALSIHDSTLQDYQAGVAYSFVDNLAVDLLVRAGYREFSLELDNLNDVFTDWSFNGPFLGVQAHF